MSLEEASRCSLDIMVKNKNSMFSSAKCEMGIVIINLSQLDLTKAHTDWYVDAAFVIISISYCAVWVVSDIICKSTH